MAVKTSLNPSGRGTLWTQPSNVWLNQTTRARTPGQGIGTMQDYFQQYLQQMQQAQTWQQQQAAQAKTSAQKYISELSPKLEGYLERMQKSYDSGLSTLQNAGGDTSYLKQAWRKAMAGYANPGWGDKTVRQMKGSASAQGVAQQNAGVRQLERSMAGRGMNGPAADYLRASIKGQYGARTARAMTGIDVNAATYAADSKKQYLGMAGQYASDLASQQRQYANALANYQQSYNPLNWLQQTQSILSPLQTMGYGSGYGSAI